MASPTVVQFPNAAPAPDLLEEIRRREDARLRALSKAYARSVAIASDIDPESCLRRQVLNIVAWQEKPLADTVLQARFEAGNLQEREGIKKLIDLGFEVVEQQVTFELVRRGGGKEVVLRGKTDGKIRWGQERVPFEVKSLHPNIYQQIDTIEDFQRWGWARRYPSQLEAYLVGHGAEWGFFLLTDCLGHWKTIRVDLDYDLAERIWVYAEKVYEGVGAWRKDSTLPAYTKDISECARCEFFGGTCNPPSIEAGAALLSDPDLINDLERREALIAAGAKDLDKLDHSIKARLKAALAVPEQEMDETLEAYGARLKALGPKLGTAGRFAVSIGVKVVRPEEKPRAGRVDRVVSIEPVLDTPMPAGDGHKVVSLMDTLKKSIAAEVAKKGGVK